MNKETNFKLDFSSHFYKNCCRRRKEKAKICGECPFRKWIEKQEKIRTFKVKEIIDIPGKGKAHSVSYFENFEDIVGKRVELNGKVYVVKEVDRNKCSGFFNGTDEEWEKRDVWLLV